MKMSFVLASAALALAAPPAVAGDSFFEIINGTDQRSTTASNQVFGAGQIFVVGRLRSVLDLAPAQTAHVAFSVYGASAQATDFFKAYGSSLAALPARSAPFETQLTSAGLLDLAFGHNATTNVVTNPGNASWLDANFGIILDPGRRSGWLLFEDARLGSDYDYDDLVVKFQMRLSATAPVPEPSAVLLAVAGIGVLGVVANRRRQRRDVDGAV